MIACVTGAAGFIGSRLAERLTADGHLVRAVDIEEPTDPLRRKAWDAADARMLADLRYEHRARLAVEGCDTVFHLAANHGGVGFLHHNGPAAYRDNTRMSVAVIEAALERGVGRLFFASSACAYPVDRQRYGAAETLREPMLGTGDPDGLYGLEKLATLRLCEGLQAAGDLDARVGVFNTVFGPGQAVTGERAKFPPAVVAKAFACAESGEPLTLWGDGTQVRQNIYIDDALDKVLAVMSPWPYRGPVNITGVDAVSCDEVANLALDLVGADVPVVHADGPTGPMDRQVSNDRWEAVYGADTQWPFPDRFAQFVDWMRSCVYAS